MPDGELPEQADVLERAGDAKRDALMRRQGGYVLSLEHDAAGRQRKEPADQVHGRTLAGAIRPDQSKHFTRADGKIDVVDRAHAAEMPGQVLELKHRTAPF